MKKILLLFPLLMCSSTVTSCNRTTSIKIMSYNIQHGVCDRTKKVDLDPVIEIIKKYNPDILNINEIYGEGRFGNQVQYIADKLGYKGYFVHAATVGYGHYGGALFSRFGFEKTLTHAIPNPTEYPKVEKRAIGEIEVKIPGNGVLHVFQSHFGYESKSKELEWKNSIDVLTPLVKGNARTVFMGDLNMTPTGDPDKRYVDQIKDLMNPTIADNLPSYPSDKPTEHIDYIFCSKELTFEPGQVLEDVYADHRPVLTTINL